MKNEEEHNLVSKFYSKKFLVQKITQNLRERKETQNSFSRQNLFLLLPTQHLTM